MQITYIKEDQFEIKTKNGSILTGENPKINDITLSGPGEYEIAEIIVDGLPGNIYLFSLEEMTVAHLDKLNNTLTDEQVDKIDGVDILLVPVGGSVSSAGGQGTLNPKQALEVINQIDPKIVIPMDFGGLAEFCKMEGVCQTPLPSFKIAKGALPEEERKVVILCPQKK